MTAAFRQEFEACLGLKSVPPQEHFDMLLVILWKYNMIYEVKEVHPRFFLVHIANRDYLMMNPKNAHVRGAQIKASGADLGQLTNAYCIELPEAGDRRDEHIDANLTLIENAAGLLAVVNGQELYVTVGCGHTSQICKTADVGGITCEPSLQMRDSTTIDKQSLCSNANFATMLNRGWSWKVVKSSVDVAYPRFAEIAQGALNVRNHSSSSMGELEVCMTLAKRSSVDGRNEAVSLIERLCAPCKGYASVLLDYAANFGGGDDSFIITFVDGVSKQFNASVAMGEVFWTAVTYTEFFDKTCKYPLVRAALLLCNLTTSKVEDGIARLLSKSDVKTAAGKNCAVAATRAERTLQEALDIVESISSIAKCLKPLGLFFVRIGLKLIGAEKKGREGTEYSMKRIRSLFLDGMAVIMHGPVHFDKWEEVQDDSEDDHEDAPKPKASRTEESADAVQLASLGDHASDAWLCSQAGFDIGSQVKEKALEPDPEHLYVIFDIDDGKVSLHQVCSFSGAPIKVSVAIAELLKNWTISRVEPPVSMKQVPALPSAFGEQLKRNDAFKAIVDLHIKHSKNYDQLSYYRRPDHVRTSGFIKAGALVLIPLVPAAGNIMFGNKSGSIVIGDCCLFPAAKPALQGAPDEWAKNSVVAAYWWITKTTDKKLVNVEESMQTIRSIDVPTLTNCVDLKPFTRLYAYTKPKSPAVPLSNATVEDVDGAGISKASKPAAKGKAKAKVSAVKKRGKA